MLSSITENGAHRQSPATPQSNGASPQNDAPLLAFATFVNKRDNTPKINQLTWREIVAKLTAHSIRKGKDGALFSPTLYPDGATRAKENVQAVSCLVLDFDGGNAPDALTAQWDAAGYAYALYSTHSHKPDAPKWRAVFPLAAPITGDQWESVYRKLAAALGGGHADPSCKDASRIYYLPSCVPEYSDHAFAFANEGAPIDEKEFPDAAPVLSAQRTTASTPISAPAGNHERYAEIALENELDKLRSAANGDRNNQLNRTSHALGQLTAARVLDRVAIENELTAMAAAIGLPASEAARTIQSGLNAGEKEPRQLPQSRNARLAGSAKPLCEVALKDLPTFVINKNGGDQDAAPMKPLESLQIYNKPPHDEIRKPPTRFAMRPYFPRGEVTLFSGHGGSGKSYLALALAACIAAGKDWSAGETEQNEELKVLTASFEDTAQVTAWRMKNVCNAYSLDIDRVWRNWEVAHTPECFAPLVREIGSGNKGIEKTDAWHDLEEKVKGRDIVFIDNASDVFMANANDPALVREFIRELQVLARDNDSAIVLLGHIDKSGNRYGTGGDSYTGTTAWHNTVRSRIALVPTDGVLQLVHEKANLSERAESVFIVKDSDNYGAPIIANAQEIADGRDAEAGVEVLLYAPEVLEVLKKANERGMHVTTNRGSGTNVHTQLKSQGLSKMSPGAFFKTLNHLIDTGEIITATYQNSAKAEKEEFRIAEQEAKPSEKEGEKIA